MCWLLLILEWYVARMQVWVLVFQILSEIKLEYPPSLPSPIGQHQLDVAYHLLARLW
jgi:hypothetical protein